MRLLYHPTEPWFAYSGGESSRLYTGEYVVRSWFHWPDGKPGEDVTARGTYEDCMDWLARALRHSAATILYANGVPLEAIADMLGHSTTRVTADLYRHRVERVQRGAADAMQTALIG